MGPSRTHPHPSPVILGARFLFPLFEVNTMTNPQTPICKPASPAQRLFDHGGYCKTGGIQSRDMVFYACWTPDNRCNDVMRVVEMGGPLDAPSEIPAGSCNANTWHSGADKTPLVFRPSVSTIPR